MAAVEKVYEVLEGKKYTGKHGVYNSGDKFKESELFGSLDNAVKNGLIKLSVADKTTKKVTK